jgi:hypothetical protein
MSVTGENIQQVVEVVQAPRRRRSGLLSGALLIILLLLIAADAFILVKRGRYRAEIERLRGSMSEAERERTTLLLASDEKRGQVVVELVRRQARGDASLHLAVSVDSGIMHLQREGARLRDMPVEVGGERVIGDFRDSLHLAIPLGTRTIQALLTEGHEWEVPALVFSDRGQALPEDRSVAGALGPYAIVLSGGTIIYSLPTKGPLADSTYLLPAAIRARAGDLQAVFPNLRIGMRVYFY